LLFLDVLENQPVSNGSREEKRREEKRRGEKRGLFRPVENSFLNFKMRTSRPVE